VDDVGLQEVVTLQTDVGTYIAEGFGAHNTYKTCGFAWMKADVSSINLFDGPVDAAVGMGYWTRSNSEVALLATRGSPKRRDAGVRQGIIEPRREHSRKPECIHGRIERLVAGPYVELFARQRVAGWDAWGNQTKKFVSSQRNHDR
jgi:N6-adenosine-specific RNA methylase IME4